MLISSEKERMMTQPATVFVVDDDPDLRESIRLLGESVQLYVECFSSAEAFLAKFDPSRLGCLLLDIRMPGMGGLQLQSELKQRKSTLPIIFLTGSGDVPMAVEAVEAGAYRFFLKPFRCQKLLDNLQQAIQQDRDTH